jgi:hydrogenase maturation protease
MIKALVLACGNSLRGDDGVALQVVNDLQKTGCDPATEFRWPQQWTPELAEPISKAEVVVFVDAALDAPAGSIACTHLLPNRSTSLGGTHHSSPESLLLLAEELYGKRPLRAYLVTVAGAAFELEENLSDPVRSAIPGAVERIKALLSVSVPD